MHVFITGASGFIGTEIVQQLLAIGHTVTGLVRSDTSVQKLTSLGATPLRGSQTDLDILRKAATEADAVIHCAFSHDLFFKPNGFVLACNENEAAITAMCDAIVGTGKTFIHSSGTLGTLGEDELCGKAGGHLGLRGLSETLVQSYSDRGVRGINMRLAPLVHAVGSTHEHMFITSQIESAKKSGFVGYVGEGTNLWPAVHVSAAANLYVLAITSEKIKAGSNLHAIAEEGIPTREIAEFIGKKLGMETKSVAPEDAIAHWGFMGGVLQGGGKTTTKWTREWTGWTPTGPGLFADLETYTF